jgi:hypothetical protein
MSISPYFRPNIHQNGPESLGVKVQIMIDLSSNPFAVVRKQLRGSASLIWGKKFLFINSKSMDPKPRI